MWGTCCGVCAVFTRAVNTLLVSERKHAGVLVKFPSRGKTYRGGGIPDHFRAFFDQHKTFCVAGFLATSFSREKAEEFMCFADQRGEPCVMWEVQVDPAGERSAARRCLHVNYVTRSNVPGEDEYLFAPYSPFTVKEVHAPVTTLVVIELLRCCTTQHGAPWCPAGITQPLLGHAGNDATESLQEADRC